MGRVEAFNVLISVEYGAQMSGFLSELGLFTASKESDQFFQNAF